MKHGDKGKGEQGKEEPSHARGKKKKSKFNAGTQSGAEEVGGNGPSLLSALSIFIYYVFHLWKIIRNQMMRNRGIGVRLLPFRGTLGFTCAGEGAPGNRCLARLCQATVLRLRIMHSPGVKNPPRMSAALHMGLHVPRNRQIPECTVR